MVSDWEKVTLVDHCQKIGSGATPRGGSSVYLEEGEIALIRSQNIYNEGFSKDGLVYITVDAAEKLKNVIVEEDDILLNITGDSVARVCMVDNSYLPARVNQHVSIVRPKAESFNAKFLRYYLTSPYMQQLMLNYSSAGATRKALTKSMIENLEVLKPSLEVQNNIAHILGTLDDKIELNRQMNETLEAMAQALFKSWFVDFDPVIDNALLTGKVIPEPLKERAEMRQAQLDSGKAKTNSEINDLFPSEFEFTEELGWIPKGWSASTVKSICSKVQNGGTPRRNQDEYWDNGDIPWLTSGEVRDKIIIETDNRITQLGLENSSAKWLPSGATVVAMYGATAGQVAMTTIGLTTNQAICGLIPKDNNTLFVYLTLLNSISYLESQATGSAQQNINKGIIENTEIVVPDGNVLDEFERHCSKYFERITTNLNYNHILANLRDTLLPKLMSGELRIADAEKLVADI